MTGHRTYLHVGHGTIRRTNHAGTPKGHRAFTHPVTPKESKLNAAA
jgi:hypothetical protein